MNQPLANVQEQSYPSKVTPNSKSLRTDTMKDDLNHDELAEKVFYVKHIYTSNPIQMDPECTTERALLITELHGLDAVAVKATNGKRIVTRQSLVDATGNPMIDQLATRPPQEAWINYNATLR